MREDFWSFDPSHTFVMLTNHEPIVGGTDEGIWRRRLRLVPFGVIIPGDERDENLGEKLAAEAGAILAWLVAGYLDWRRNGLAEPDKVTEATQAYRAESDPLGRFLDERCLRMPALHAGSTEPFGAYEKWCAAEREDPGTPKAFGEALKIKGFESYKSHGVMRWRGVGLAHENGTEGEGGEDLCRSSRARVVPTLKTSPPSPALPLKRSWIRISGTAGEEGEDGECLRLRAHARTSRARTLPKLPARSADAPTPIRTALGDGVTASACFSPPAYGSSSRRTSGSP